jgi:putative glycosyl hydrolase-like family 15 (GHL15) protein
MASALRGRAAISKNQVREVQARQWFRYGSVVVALLAGATAGGGWLATNGGKASVGPAAPRTGITAPHRPVADAFFRPVYASYGGTPLTPAQEGARYRIMVINPADAAIIPALKARNPDLKVLTLIDMMSTDVNDPSGPSDWVGYTDANANHPEWFLTDADGSRLGFQHFPGALVMDVGNPEYQQAGLAKVIAQLNAGGFDGVLLDDANASLRWVIAGGSAACAKYPTDQLWQSAVYSFLSNVGPALRKAGFLVLANIGGSTVTPGRTWQTWNGPLDGAMEESFTNGGAGRDSIRNGEWLPKLKHAVWSEAHEKISLDHARTRTRRGARYGVATMLLAANGNNSFYASAHYATEIWWPEYTTAKSLGRPLGEYRILRNGVYRRDFAHGVVLVNPHAHPASRVRLGGRYSGSGRHNVTSIKLRATSGVVLRRS